MIIFMVVLVILFSVFCGIAFALTVLRPEAKYKNYIRLKNTSYSSKGPEAVTLVVRILIIDPHGDVIYLKEEPRYFGANETLILHD